ncbi:hypothetical protein L1887_08824 [Cichorium endivia]|nr:hypothetical protein L1887_08824 [Cichorium endivia]
MSSPPFTIYACYHCPNRRTIATIGPPLSSSRSTATLLHLIGKFDVATIVDAMDRQLFCFSTTTTTPHLLKSHITTISTIRTQCIANYTFINDVKLNFLDDRLVCVGYSSAGLLALMLFWDNLRKFRLGRSIEHFVLFQCQQIVFITGFWRGTGLKVQGRFWFYHEVNKVFYSVFVAGFLHGKRINFLFKLSKEDSQLKAIDFGLSEFITPESMLLLCLIHHLEHVALANEEICRR